MYLSMLGDAGVGKTALLAKIAAVFCTDGKINYSEFVRVPVTIKDHEYIVDITEQNITEESILGDKHANAMGWIVVFDVRTITSLDNLDEYYNKYKKLIIARAKSSGWLEEGSEPDPTDLHLILVGTNGDLASQVDRIPKAIIEEFARSKSARYFETSKESNENVKEALSAVVKSISKSELFQKHDRCVVQ